MLSSIFFLYSKDICLYSALVGTENKVQNIYTVSLCNLSYNLAVNIHAPSWGSSCFKAEQETIWHCHSWYRALWAHMTIYSFIPKDTTPFYCSSASMRGGVRLFK
jgi:hypothetical protein